MKMIRVRLSVPEYDEPVFNDEVNMNNIDEFTNKFDEMISKYNLGDDFNYFKDRITEEVKDEEDPDYKTSYDLNITKKVTNKNSEEDIVKKNEEFFKRLKDSNWINTAPKEVVDFLDSLDSIKKPEKPKIDPNEDITFWITYQATFLTELYSPEFFKRNPQEVLDDIDDLSLKISLKRSELNTKQPYELIKKRFIETMLKTLNIDPTSLGTEFKDSFLAKTGIIYMDIIGVDLTKTMQEKYAGNDSDIDSFMVATYMGMNNDTDIITYRDVESLIK